MKTNPKPFTNGSILRIGPGPSALMQVETISENHAGIGKHRYYGSHIMGGLVGVYHSDVIATSESDIEIWNSLNSKNSC